MIVTHSRILWDSFDCELQKNSQFVIIRISQSKLTVYTFTLCNQLGKYQLGDRRIAYPRTYTARHYSHSSKKSQDCL